LPTQRYIQEDNTCFNFHLLSGQCESKLFLMAYRHEVNPRGKSPRYPLDRKLSGPRTGLERRRILSLPGLQSLDRPARSQSQYHVLRKIAEILNNDILCSGRDSNLKTSLEY
jgi:hypothetical protein